MSAGKRTTISSTVLPRSFSAADWPPITLPLPGRAITAVTPSATANLNWLRSGAIPSGWIESITRSCGVAGSLPSLSSVSPPLAPRPMCEWASIKPGVIVLPFTSMMRAPAGISTIPAAPTARIFPFLTTSTPSGIPGPAAVRRRAPRKAIASAGCAPAGMLSEMKAIARRNSRIGRQGYDGARSRTRRNNAARTEHVKPRRPSPV